MATVADGITQLIDYVRPDCDNVPPDPETAEYVATLKIICDQLENHVNENYSTYDIEMETN